MQCRTDQSIGATGEQARDRGLQGIGRGARRGMVGGAHLLARNGADGMYVMVDDVERRGAIAKPVKQPAQRGADDRGEGIPQRFGLTLDVVSGAEELLVVGGHKAVRCNCVPRSREARHLVPEPDLEIVCKRLDRFLGASECLFLEHFHVERTHRCVLPATLQIRIDCVSIGWPLWKEGDVLPESRRSAPSREIRPQISADGAASLRTRSRRASADTGFRRNSVIPMSRACMTWRRSACPVTMMIGRSGRQDRARRTNSNPSMPGITRSVTTMSGLYSAMIWRPYSALPASNSRVAPKLSRIALISRRICSLSSTMAKLNRRMNGSAMGRSMSIGTRCGCLIFKGTRKTRVLDVPRSHV